MREGRSRLPGLLAIYLCAVGAYLSAWHGMMYLYDNAAGAEGFPDEGGELFLCMGCLLSMPFVLAQEYLDKTIALILNAMVWAGVISGVFWAWRSNRPANVRNGHRFISQDEIR